MSLQLESLLRHHLGDLRHQPTPKRVRASADGVTVADSTKTVIVWEPRRVVPHYAFPASAVTASVEPGEVGPAQDDKRPVLDPSVPFAVHTTPGKPLTVAGKAGAGFQPDDKDLAGFIVLDFDAFDWMEEDEPVIGHPRDPFHRIDTRRSSRHVVVERDGHVLADSRRATLLFETNLPVRFYLPREDVRVDLRPSPTHTICAYKGVASYWDFDLDGQPVTDLVWSYEDAYTDAGPVQGLVCFYDEHFDLTVDDVARRRPKTQWS